MGSMIEPLICPSLARGIRRAYFAVLDANWAEFGRRMKAFRQRTGGIDISSPKAFRREVERFQLQDIQGWINDQKKQTGKEKIPRASLVNPTGRR